MFVDGRGGAPPKVLEACMGEVVWPNTHRLNGKASIGIGRT